MAGGYYYTRDAVSPQVSPVYMPYAQQTPQAPYLANFNSAYALIVAGPDYPSITGLVTFADVPGGVRVCADIAGLPPYKPASGEKQQVGPFGFHIHEKGHCEVGDRLSPLKPAGDTGTRRTSHMAITPVIFLCCSRMTGAHRCVFLLISL